MSLLFVSEPVDGKVRPSVPSLYAGKTATPRRIEPSGRKNEPSQSPPGGEEGMRARADMSGAITVSDRASCGLRKSLFSTRLRSSPQRVVRLREIRERPRISERLVVFSVHTSKVAYQDWCGTDRPRIIGQSTVEFTQPSI